MLNRHPCLKFPLLASLTLAILLRTCSAAASDSSDESNKYYTYIENALNATDLMEDRRTAILEMFLNHGINHDAMFIIISNDTLKEVLEESGITGLDENEINQLITIFLSFGDQKREEEMAAQQQVNQTHQEALQQQINKKDTEIEALINQKKEDEANILKLKEDL